MAWSAPYTAIAGGVVAAADFNTYVRDNLMETMPPIALTVGGWFTVDGTNSLVERVPSTDVVDTSQTTTSVPYANLATVGPTVTVTTGTKAIVAIGARIGQNTGASGAPSNKMSWAISGATTRAADDAWAAGIVQTGTGNGPAIYTSRWYLADSLTPGSNTFQAKYAVSSGTGSFQFRSMHVIPL